VRLGCEDDDYDDDDDEVARHRRDRAVRTMTMTMMRSLDICKIGDGGGRCNDEEERR